MISINLPFGLRYPELKSFSDEWIRINVDPSVREWLNESKIKYQYSMTDHFIWFETEEDKVKFILRFC